MNRLHIAFAACIEAVIPLMEDTTSHAAPVTAHTDDVIAHVEDAKPHLEAARSHIDDAKAHIDHVHHAQRLQHAS